jgi:hypothetical protein
VIILGLVSAWQSPGELEVCFGSCQSSMKLVLQRASYRILICSFALYEVPQGILVPFTRFRIGKVM